MLAELYAPFKSPLLRTNLENAEAIKCFSSVYNAMKVSFVNELYLIAQRCGLDHETITEAMIKSSLGIRIPGYYSKGGYPFGGKCLPEDLIAITSFVKEQGLDSRFFEIIADINERMKSVESNARKS
jgi:UDP-glucose 6-dehydrogenase